MQSNRSVKSPSRNVNSLLEPIEILKHFGQPTPSPANISNDAMTYGADKQGRHGEDKGLAIKSYTSTVWSTASGDRNKTGIARDTKTDINGNETKSVKGASYQHKNTGNENQEGFAKVFKVKSNNGANKIDMKYSKSNAEARKVNRKSYTPGEIIVVRRKNRGRGVSGSKPSDGKRQKHGKKSVKVTKHSSRQSDALVSHNKRKGIKKQKMGKTKKNKIGNLKINKKTTTTEATAGNGSETRINKANNKTLHNTTEGEMNETANNESEFENEGNQTSGVNPSSTTQSVTNTTTPETEMELEGVMITRTVIHTTEPTTNTTIATVELEPVEKEDLLQGRNITIRGRRKYKRRKIILLGAEGVPIYLVRRKGKGCSMFREALVLSMLNLKDTKLHMIFCTPFRLANVSLRNALSVV